MKQLLTIFLIAATVFGADVWLICNANPPGEQVTHYGFWERTDGTNWTLIGTTPDATNGVQFQRPFGKYTWSATAFNAAGMSDYATPLEFELRDDSVTLKRPSAPVMLAAVIAPDILFPPVVSSGTVGTAPGAPTFSVGSTGTGNTGSAAETFFTYGTIAANTNNALVAGRNTLSFASTDARSQGFGSAGSGTTLSYSFYAYFTNFTRKNLLGFNGSGTSRGDLRLSSTNGITLTHGSTVINTTASYSPGFVLNTWYHIGVTAVGSGNMILYVNGLPVATNALTAGNVIGGAGWTVGDDADSIQGRLAACHMWHGTALTADNMLYLGGNTPYKYYNGGWQ